MSKKFPNFYVPGSGGDIWLQDVPESQDNPDSEMDERDEILLSSRENFYSIWNACTQNSKIVKLWENIWLEEFDLAEFIEQEKDLNTDL